MVEKIKVCCFCEKWESGGIESFLNNVIGKLDPEKFQIDIVAACLRQSVFTELLQNRGVRFFELSGKQRDLVKNHKQFLSLLRREQYHVVHFNLFEGLALAYVGTAKRAGVSIRIAHSHNTALRKSATKQLKILIHNIGKYIFAGEATERWACSEKAAEFLFPRGELKRRGYRFIPNGIEVERFHFDSAAREQVRMELGLTDQFVIGNVGRLCDQKNQSFLLEVFAQVKRRKPDSCLLLVGEGELLECLKKQTQRLGIADSVIFYGIASHVERLLWGMDVFVLPSQFEGLPVTSIEAQMAGLPCVFSDVITQECAIADSTIFLSLTAGARAWADAIIEQQLDITHRVENNAAKEQTFSIDHVAKTVEAVYSSAVKQVRGGKQDVGLCSGQAARDGADARI